MAPVFRYKIYERDGWKCKICRKAVKRDAVVPHPMAPTIDHILPLAAGGTHEPANVQCAHFLCNAQKGDRPADDQLMLIG
ncbi:MAG: HNH endonuclease signature motif containing protein [Aquihabitans sp.]